MYQELKTSEQQIVGNKVGMIAENSSVYNSPTNVIVASCKEKSREIVY